MQFLSSHPVWFAVHAQEGSEKLQPLAQSRASSFCAVAPFCPGRFPFPIQGAHWGCLEVQVVT